jgi:hypothetical protein
MKGRGWLLALLLLALAAPALGEGGLEGEQVFIVNDSRYQPLDSGGDPDTGHALCGTRCNALSVDYRNVIDPGGWRFVKIAGDRELVLDLDNPFFGGQCVCTVDEYVVLLNEFNQGKAADGQ